MANLRASAHASFQSYPEPSTVLFQFHGAEMYSLAWVPPQQLLRAVRAAAPYIAVVSEGVLSEYPFAHGISSVKNHEKSISHQPACLSGPPWTATKSWQHAPCRCFYLTNPCAWFHQFASVIINLVPRDSPRVCNPCTLHTASYVPSTGPQPCTLHPTL